MFFFARYRQSLDEQLEQHEKYKALVDKRVSFATNYWTITFQSYKNMMVIIKFPNSMM